MKKAYNKFLIVSTIFLAIGGVYLYFSNNLNSDTLVPTAYGSSLGSSNDSTGVAPSTQSLSEKISSDISFLNTLTSLNKIKIDTSLFSDQSFNILQNNSVNIESVNPGRVNPFAPINTNNTNTNILAPKTTTDQPTTITTNSVILNGTVNTLAGVTDAYFEYGLTPALGTPVVTVKPSLVGTFIKNVLGLTPKTNYYYRACAKMNNTPLCGDVVSFTTK